MIHVISCETISQDEISKIIFRIVELELEDSQTG